ncbi:MAG: hypothetical protein J6I37_05920 [Prevotella sp.]|nr:hypothetical protein [Prevotella sp.]
MKKIFLLFVAICGLAACDPTHEKIDNAGHISIDELKAKTTVTVDKAASGQNGNVVTCSTSAPVNAVWNIGGKNFIGNYAWKKMKLGSHSVVMTAICADGTELSLDFPIECQEITDPLTKYWIYGEDPEKEPAFSPGAWDAAAMRFSSTEGAHFPTISDDVYFGLKTLIFEITDATPDCAGRVMNGWWSARYDDEKDVQFTNGLWELPITEKMAKDCAKGGDGKDLDLMVTSGSCTIKSVYYEE